MPRKPDYKKEKKLREAAQRKRNEDAQQRRIARKSDNPAGHAPTESDAPETP